MERICTRPPGFDSRGFTFVSNDGIQRHVIPAKSTALRLDMEYKTLRNKLWNGTLELTPIYLGNGRGRLFFDEAQVDQVKLIRQENTRKTHRGRPTNASLRREAPR
jgi:hypothetical protein